jgi:undecaprenyl pyrophosphate synthase
VVFSNKLWPEFKDADFIEIIKLLWNRFID